MLGIDWITVRFVGVYLLKTDLLRFGVFGDHSGLHLRVLHFPLQHLGNFLDAFLIRVLVLLSFDGFQQLSFIFYQFLADSLDLLERGN